MKIQFKRPFIQLKKTNNIHHPKEHKYIGMILHSTLVVQKKCSDKETCQDPCDFVAEMVNGKIWQPKNY